MRAHDFEMVIGGELIEDAAVRAGQLALGDQLFADVSTPPQAPEYFSFDLTAGGAVAVMAVVGGPQRGTNRSSVRGGGGGNITPGPVGGRGVQPVGKGGFVPGDRRPRRRGKKGDQR